MERQMNVKIKSRLVHLLTLLVVVALAYIINLISPNLTDKATDTMAFIGFWVTVYGLLVAIFEIARLGSVSDEMLKTATSAYNGLKLQLELQEVASCLEIINSSVSELKSNKAVPIIFISRIKRVYFSVFPEGQATKEHERNILLLNSYEHVSAVRKLKSSDNTLYQNTSQIDGSHKAREHPYQTTIDTLKRMHDDLSKYSASKNAYKSEVI
jgi:hypothetical protein